MLIEGFLLAKILQIWIKKKETHKNILMLIKLKNRNKQEKVSTKIVYS